MKTNLWRPHAVMVLVLAVVGMCLAYGQAAAGQIAVNGQLGAQVDPNTPGQVIAQYFEQTTVAPSLSGSASIDVPAGNFGVISSSGHLATGELKAFAQSDVSGSGGYGAVEMRETIHIEGLLPSPVTGAFTAVLEGTLIPSPLEGQEIFNATAFAFFQLSVNNDGPFSQYNFQTIGCPPGGVIDTQVCINTTTIHYQISVPFTISDFNRDFHLYASIIADSAAGGITDISNTVSLGVILPAGLTFTSDSGVFLTQLPPVGQVPEPATLALLSTGMLGLGVARWRLGPRKR